MTGRDVDQNVNAVQNSMSQKIRFTQSARRHRVGRAHAVHVIENAAPHEIPADGELDARNVWIGPDDRGVELEIVAVVLPAELLVVHAMPTALRRK